LKNIPEPVRRLGLLANPEKESSAAVVSAAARVAAELGFSLVATGETAALGGIAAEIHDDPRELAAACDVLMVFGGDGTILGAARGIVGVGTPILGINIGGLGFLTAASSERLEESMRLLRARAFRVEERMLIQAVGMASGVPVNQVALNDFVFSRGMVSRLIDLGVRVDGEFLTHYRCDGLIVSSPTGSTAYSLAAGGAIVSPSAPVLTITPICPHTLSNRSLILSWDSEVEVEVLCPKLDVFLTADGQSQCPLDHGDVIQLKRGAAGVRLVRFDGDSFFSTLRQKLNWSGSNI
jgi:NAD+ kinase